MLETVIELRDYTIEPTSAGAWEDQDFNDVFIGVYDKSSSDSIFLTLNDAKQLIESLQKIVVMAEEQIAIKFKIGDKVKVISGRLEGLTGTIRDIDRINKVRPLYIRIDDSVEIESCAYFCGYDVIEKI